MARQVTIDLSKKQVEQINLSHAEFHHAYGVAMAMWAGVERGLFYWFCRVTGMSEDMARAVFYSARSFNGRGEMLEAAISHAPRLTDIEATFIKAAIKKAWTYSGFRNRLAHGEPTMEIIQTTDRKTGEVSRSIHWSIVQGKSKKPNPAVDVSMKDLMNAADNFHRLRQLLMESASKERSPEECLRLVVELPNQANSKNDPTPSTP